MIYHLYSLLYFYSSLPQPYRFAFMPIPLVDLQIHSEMPVDLYQPGIMQSPLSSMRFISTPDGCLLRHCHPLRWSSHHACLHPALYLFFSLFLLSASLVNEDSLANLQGTHHRIISSRGAIPDCLVKGGRKTILARNQYISMLNPT